MGACHHLAGAGLPQFRGSSGVVRPAASLLELLVVLFIMGIMMGLLLPALQAARDRAQATVCENNVRQLGFAVQGFVGAKRKFPDPYRWTVDALPWMEQRPLADEMKHNKDPNRRFPRPPLMRCPMQDDLASRVEAVGWCHYILVVDRSATGEMERGWEIQDRPLATKEETDEPWYTGPEISYAMRDQLLANERGPHPSGRYMTAAGLRPE